MTEFMTISETAAFIEDGQTLALGGMTVYRRPMAFVRQLLRHEVRPRGLTLLCFTAGLESDLLVGAGCVETVRSVYFGLESFGLAPMYTDLVQQGRIRVLEETEASIVLGLRAQTSGVGFMPSHAWFGTDLPRLRSDVRTVTDPYTGEELMAFPSIPLDTAILHGLEADRYGNVKLNNNLGIDMELAYAAKRVIVTVERMVEQVRPAADATILPAPASDVIVCAPEGAWPTSCYPVYPVSGGEFMRYVEMCNAGEFDQYLLDFVADTRSDETASG